MLMLLMHDMNLRTVFCKALCIDVNWYDVCLSLVYLV